MFLEKHECEIINNGLKIVLHRIRYLAINKYEIMTWNC